MGLKKIRIEELQFNPMTMIANEWMLITAGDQEKGCNTMTASWGHLGAIWGKMTATIYIRPQRYTKEFVDNSDYFTLSVLDGSFKKELGYLGRVSGRDEDKIKETGLTPVYQNGTTYFEEAKLVFVCKKLYRAPIKEEGFVDETLIDSYYPKKDYHDMYVGEIVEVLVKE